MILPACIFTHSGAALRLPWAVRGALLAGLIPVVCQDGADPLPPQTLGWLEAQGVEVRTTTFTRRGNLNGTDCAAGIASELEAACVRYACSHAIKLDDDTIIVDPAIFTRHLLFDAVGLTHTDGRPGAYGLAYMLSRRIACVIAAELETLPLDTRVPEDLTIWHQAKRHGLCHELPFDPGPIGGPWSAILPHHDAPDAVKRFAVLTVGNEPPRGWKDADRQRAGEMRRLVEAAERFKLTASSALP